ncbi:MAG: AbrB/MazE/SpoVT family DNA-binding domain-containing protein [Alphaproteobacteria bacterium]|nr:AbrB/MazE/SpoVT family DNA-binding domain-containing protein [Alphaproteobacteria bacterium]
MTDIARISTKGQVVIPQAIRDELDLQDGTPVAVARVADMIVMRRLDVPNLRERFGRLKASLRKASGRDVSETQIMKWVREDRKLQNAKARSGRAR